MTHQPSWGAFVQGFIEGKYVPLEEGENVTASMDVVAAETPELAAALSATKKGDYALE